eukprot:6119573-Amphidinium_carterae.1
MDLGELTALQQEVLGLGGSPKGSAASPAWPCQEDEAPELDALLSSLFAAASAFGKEHQRQRRTAHVHPQSAKLRPTLGMAWKSSLVMLVLGLGHPFIRMWANNSQSIVTLNPHDSEHLKDVLFGGDPWLIYCTDNSTRVKGAPLPMTMEKALQPHHVPQAVEEARFPLGQTHGVQVGLLACWETLESGRSVAERFNLPPSPPLLFLAASGEPPKTIDLRGLRKGEDLVEKVVPLLKVATGRIENMKQWQSLCTSRRACVVIGHKTKAQRDSALAVFRPLLESNRRVKVVTLDTSLWRLKLDDALMEARPGKAGRASVICLARSTDSAGARARSGAFLQDS